MSSKEENISPATNNQLIASNIPPPRNSVSPRDYRIRPLYRLTVELIGTYRRINQVYYEARAASLVGQQEDNRNGVHNDGYDDSAYDYIIRSDEIFADRYIIKHRIGKGSFGQVFCAYDRLSSSEVAIKIIKSRRPFMAQAQTEIEILNLLYQRDRADEYNLVRLLDTFVYRNHQCLIFEMLSHNLYDLLKNTRFRGISLNLIRKFSRQILKALDFLAQSHIDIIHCDLKPENILLKHPRRSAIKLIDFGSSCFSYGRTYTYIQSRFYRSPEVLLGIPYDHKIDMWSLACVLVEMHCGEPLFAGQDQLDQICRIVDIMGMPPLSMLERSPAQFRSRFFDRMSPAPEEGATPAATTAAAGGGGAGGGGGDGGDAVVAQDPLDVMRADDGSFAYVLRRSTTRRKDAPPRRSLEEVLGVHTGGPGGRRLGDTGHSRERYEDFLDFIRRMLAYEPLQRLSAFEAALHPFVSWSNNSDAATNSSVESTVRSLSLPAATDPEESEASRPIDHSMSFPTDVSRSVGSHPTDATIVSGAVIGGVGTGSTHNTRQNRRLRSRSAPSMHPDVVTSQQLTKKVLSQSQKLEENGEATRQTNVMEAVVDGAEARASGHEGKGVAEEMWERSDMVEHSCSAVTDETASYSSFPSGDTVESVVETVFRTNLTSVDLPSSTQFHSQLSSTSNKIALDGRAALLVESGEDVR